MLGLGNEHERLRLGIGLGRRVDCEQRVSQPLDLFDGYVTETRFLEQDRNNGQVLLNGGVIHWGPVVADGREDSERRRA